MSCVSLEIKKRYIKLFKTLFSFGVIVSIIGTAIMLLEYIGVASINEEVTTLLTTIARYTTLGLSLFVLAMVVQYIVCIFLQFRKNSVFQNSNFLNCIFNCFVALLLIVFLVLIFLRPLNHINWGGINNYAVFIYLAIIVSLSIYVVVYSANLFLYRKSNNQIDFNYLCNMYIIIISLYGLIPLIITLSGGFIDMNKIDPLTDTRKFHIWAASAYSSKFLLTIFGATIMFILIKLFNNLAQISKKQFIIKFILVCFLLAIFISLIVMLWPRDKIPYQWVINYKNITISSLFLVGWVGIICFGIQSFFEFKTMLKNLN